MNVAGLWAALSILLALTWSCRADTWISEVWLEPRQVLDDAGQLAAIGPLIEIFSSDPLQEADLVIVDAGSSSSRFGRVRQVIALSTGQSVRVVSPTGFPPNVSMGLNMPPGLFQTLNPGEQFDWSGSRAMLLYEQRTGLEGFTGKITDVPGLGPPSDVMNLDWAGNGQPWPALPQRPIFDATLVSSIARPILPDQSVPWDNTFLAGDPSLLGMIEGDFGRYQLSPGHRNLPWSPQTAPEPSTISVFFILFG